jgi:hypothetical protein
MLPVTPFSPWAVRLYTTGTLRVGVGCMSLMDVINVTARPYDNQQLCNQKDEPFLCWLRLTL